MVKDSYIVVLKAPKAAPSPRAGDRQARSRAVDATSGALAKRHTGVRVGRKYSTALSGFAATMTADVARQVAADPAVASVQPNGVVSATEVQTDPPWGLDRIDQREQFGDNKYSYLTTAKNVHAYVIDTGMRLTHSEFGGRATSGWDFVDNDADASDCAGHGTHVAGTIGGTTYGVAKEIKLVSVRVLDCHGQADDAQVIAGVDWVTANAVKPAVANLSLGGTPSAALDLAVENSIASGVTYAISGGNKDPLTGVTPDACDVSPARVPDAITVSATNQYANARPDWAAYGPCLDLFAPGDFIKSAASTGDTATQYKNGTSMAAPHVAGAAALYLADHPSASPADVTRWLVGRAGAGAVTDAGTGSPNRLLYVGPGEDFTFELDTTAGTTTAGGVVRTLARQTATGGRPDDATITVSGLPAGVRSSMDAGRPMWYPGKELSFTTSEQTAPGVYPITVSGAANGVTHPAVYTLTVQPPAADDFGVLTQSEVHVDAGATVRIPVSLPIRRGSAQTLTLAATGIFSSQFSFEPAAPASGGTATLVYKADADDHGDKHVRITATGAKVAHDWEFTIVVNPPDFTAAVTPDAGTVSPGGAVRATVTPTATLGSPGWFFYHVDGLPAGADASFDPSSTDTAKPVTMTLTTTGATPPGSYPLSIEVTAGVVKHTVAYTLAVGPVAPPDFALTAPGTLALTPGKTAEGAVRTEAVSGDPQTINLSVAGVPDGVTAQFGYPSMRSGAWSPVRFTVPATTPPGSYPVTVTATGPTTTHTATIALLVKDPAEGCSATNDTDTRFLAWGDFPAKTPVTMAGCGARAASSTATVEVHAKHERPDDVVVRLIAPDGTVFNLQHSANPGTSRARDLDSVFTVDLSGKQAAGTWTIQVSASWTMGGTLDSWTLTL